MNTNITLKLETASELQILNEALDLYAGHLAAGEVVPIIGRNNIHALDLVRTLQAEIGLKPRRGPGEYTAMRQMNAFEDDANER